MSDWQAIFSIARRWLIVLVGGLSAGLALYFGSLFLKDKIQVELSAVQAADNALQTSLAGKQTDLNNLQDDIDRFTVLRQQGLVGKADRAGWIEQLLASHRRSGLPDTLSYALQVPKPLAQQGGAADPAAPQVDAAPGAATGPQFYDLNMELSNIQEEELLALLRDYQAQVNGRFRVNACTLSGRSDIGLSAHCTLRFFTVPDGPTKPPAQ